MIRRLKIYQVGSPKNFIKTVRILVLRRTYLDIYKLKIHFWFFKEPWQNSVKNIGSLKTNVGSLTTNGSSKVLSIVLNTDTL